MGNVVTSTRLARRKRAIADALCEAHGISVAEWLRRLVDRALREEAPLLLDIARAQEDTGDAPH